MTPDLSFRTAYHDDPAARRALSGFLGRIHGLDLDRWDEAGFWDPRYRPFSFFDGGEVVSNVCVYSMRMVIDGARIDVAQISGVGTDPDRRQRGLNGELTRRALAWADARHAFTYLFADAEAVPYYERRGFRALAEARVRIPAPRCAPRPGARPVAPTAPSLFDAFRRRAPVSQRLGVLEPRLGVFHALCGLLGELVAVDELDTVVGLRRGDGEITITDVVAPNVPTFADLFPFLSAGEADVVFAFEPDSLGVTGGERIPHDGSAFVRGPCPLRPPVTFPDTARA